MRRTEIITTVAALCTALAGVGRATAAFTPTYYSDPASWSSAVGGSNECTWDFDPIGMPVSLGWGNFADQYAAFGVTAPGTWHGSDGQMYTGTPYVQVGMSPDSAWVYPAFGLSSGIAASGGIPLAFGAPVHGAAVHLVGAESWANFWMRLSFRGEYLGQANVSFGSAPAYGPPPLPGQTSVLVAFTADVEFDLITIGSNFSAYGPWGVESLWVPTSAIPTPSAFSLLAVAATLRRRRR